MDMVNDGKDPILDTPQAVKEALLSGKDLYNTETGEFWWLYNATDSIATATIHLDDPNLLAVIDNPDFDLYEDIVGGLNYTGYITDSIETIIEDGEENAPLIDPRDEVFAQIASEDGWVIASPENVRKAVQSHMAENGADAPGKENLELTAHDITADGDYSHHVATYHSTDELAESGIFGKGNLMDVSGEISLAETMSSLKSDKPVPEGLLNIDNVREWYTSAFPNDELGAELNPDLTFDDALAAIPSGTGFYDSIGAGDSVVRERIFEELCNRYGYTYDEVYDSWLNESPLPSPAISQQPEKIAVAAGYRFNLVDTRETSGIDLKGCGTVVTVDGHEYEVMKGATYEDSRKVDDLLDSHGDRPISDYRKRPQGMSLKQAVRESREASAKLAENNSGTDAPDGKDER